MFSEDDLSPYASRGMATGIAAGVRALINHFELDPEVTASIFAVAMAKAQAEYVGASEEDMESHMMKASVASGFFPLSKEEIEERE